MRDGAMAWGDAAACCIREAKPHGRPFWSIQSEHRHHWPRARPTQAAIVCCSCRRCLSSANARLRLQLRRAFCGSELMAPQLCRMRLRCAAASPQMPLLPLGYRAASTLGMACCSVQSQPAFALQGRDGRPALGTSARSLQSQAARAARRKKGSGHYALRPIYATCKGLPPEGKLHCSHLSLQNASRLQRGIGINENGADAMSARLLRLSALLQVSRCVGSSFQEPYGSTTTLSTMHENTGATLKTRPRVSQTTHKSTYIT